jgi:hypothetical protein
MIYLIGLLGIIGIALGVWGTQTRGTWSQNIGIIGGISWLLGVILFFIQTGLVNGFLYLLGTFIVGAILTRVFPKR